MEHWIEHGWSLPFKGQKPAESIEALLLAFDCISFGNVGVWALLDRRLYINGITLEKLDTGFNTWHRFFLKTWHKLFEEFSGKLVSSYGLGMYTPMADSIDRGSRGPAPQWNLGRTRTIRVPIKIADHLIELARRIDNDEPIGSALHLTKEDRQELYKSYQSANCLCQRWVNWIRAFREQESEGRSTAGARATAPSLGSTPEKT